MRKPVTKIVLVAAALAAIAAFAVGCGHHRRHGPKHVERFTTSMVDNVLDDIDATDAQAEKIQAIRANLVQLALAERDAHHEAGAAVAAELRKENPDAARVHALIDARSAAMTALAHQAGDALIEVHGVLDAKQRAELLDQIEAHHKR